MPDPSPSPLAGQSSASFEGVRKAFAANLDEGIDHGAAFCVVRHGEVVCDLWGGYADAARQRPWSRETLANIQSTTKGIVALVIAMLVERGKLAYDAPIATWWPEFAAQGKKAITLDLLMSHRAGVNGVREPMTLADLYDRTLYLDALAAMAPVYEPGAMCVYHALSYGHLCGELVRRADGREIGRFIAEEIASPLGAALYLRLPESEDNRAAEIVPGEGIEDVMDKAEGHPLAFGYANPRVRATEANTRAWRAAGVPAGGGQADARALARVYGALAQGGAIDGVRLLQPETIALATAERFDGEEGGFGWPIRYGAGFMLNKGNEFGPSRRAFGHSGWGGYFAYADPEHGLGVAFVLNRMLSAEPDFSTRRRRLLDAVYAAL